jgi:hypothetical protein
MRRISKRFRLLCGIAVIPAIIICSLIPPSPIFASDNIVSISPTTITVDSGDDFSVYLDLSIGDIRIDTIGFQLDWSSPAGSLQCTGISLATGAESFFEEIPSNQILQIYGGIADNGTTAQFCYALRNLNYIQGPAYGHVAVISFHALADGEATIHPCDVQLALVGETIPCDVADGSVTIGSGGKSAGGDGKTIENPPDSSSLVTTEKPAENDIETARKSAEDYIEHAAARIFPQWQGCKPEFVTVFKNEQNQEIGSVFFITRDGEVTGKVLVGNSQYDYHVLEADTGTTINELERDLDMLTPSIATPQQYKISRDTTQTLKLDEKTFYYGNPLDVPLRHMAATGDCTEPCSSSNSCCTGPYCNNKNCGPTSGAMIMEYWRQWCPNLPDWCDDQNELYITMLCNHPPHPGVLPSDFGPGIEQFADKYGYSFGSSCTCPVSYYTIQNDIYNGRPLGLLFTIPPDPYPEWHWNAVKGYDTDGGNYAITNDPWCIERTVDWDIVGPTCDISQIWKYQDPVVGITVVPIEKTELLISFLIIIALPVIIFITAILIIRHGKLRHLYK